MRNILKNEAIRFEKSDEGRSKYFKGEKARDCVTRAIPHATKIDRLFRLL